MKTSRPSKPFYVEFRKCTKLLISYKTGKSISTSTFARWIKKSMSLAAHSTKSAATSAAAAAGTSLKNILDTANWASVSTFKTFYHWENVNTFMDDVLAHG
ncbi:hypothetical protein KUTeg_023227 [Tegillarca granosa]|uniref:Uncharacterized protein n=1 Tax=Tegillarca granosa TaxID=220873 RepID=A0ABQ9E1M3_TEGGR|nr:hypothetical protein KUTeg_023227 [Tegillarca granosa]